MLRHNISLPFNLTHPLKEIMDRRNGSFEFGDPPFDTGRVEFKLLTYGNEHYQGEVKVGTDIRHGRGILVSNDTNYQMYEGWWRENKRAHIGRTIWKSGGVYVGQYENNLRNGEGNYSWPDGRSY